MKIDWSNTNIHSQTKNKHTIHVGIVYLNKTKNKRKYWKNQQKYKILTVIKILKTTEMWNKNK